ncbi:Z1 domain-containing protein [Mariniplasma anaerobium]|uniref:Putative endonuclease Z1 domain-containing protein n=1 Tax=Mariniplasma anaerobium TaxID=2735436 RepID=A0A7U9XUG7_9MOLU|nr:Z1 domain-containing protein [Mariniplasma anaerobium]BCR35706.1 hypothetical protein MPAN_005990 [Mariniplasma anaerobium]
MNEMLPVIDSYSVAQVTKGKILGNFIRDNLEGKIYEYQKIVDSAMNTISRFTLSNDEETKYTKSGLAFGRVQSGKTTYFLCTAACAIDNGFDLVIFLSGVTTNLLIQNKKRLQKAFRLSRRDLFFYDTSNIKDSVLNTIDDIKSVFMTLKNENVNGGVMISVLKEDDHLLKVFEIVKEFTDKRILIIDDEGDQFTPNTKVNQHKESTIFKLVKEITEISKKISLLSVTATPQANVFINKFNHLAPEFVELVEPGKGYCGLETFHSNDEYISFVTGNKKQYEEELRKALIYYMFTVYETEFHNTEKYKNNKNWMLIHNSHLKSVHIKDYKELSTILETDLREVANYYKFGTLDVMVEKITNYIRRYYVEFQIEEKFGFKCEDFLLGFNDVLACFYNSEIDVNNISIINSDEQLEYEDFQKSKCGILIGGNMLGRGITIIDLTVSFITRDRIDGRGNIDTILQRARWFGYREKILKLIKIFTTGGIQKEFNGIYHHDTSLYDEIKYCIENNIDLRESKLPVKISDKLDLTRRNVILKGSLKRSNTSNFMQQRKFAYLSDYKIHDNINNKIYKFLKKQKFEKTIKDIPVYDVESSEFYRILKDYIDNPEIYIINERLYESLIILFNSAKRIKLILMKNLYDDSKGYTLSRDSVFTDRSVYSGNVLSGASQSGDYLGDLYHFSEFDHVQIHFTKIKDTKGVELYGGNKILFLAINNTKIKPQGFIQRV